MTKYAEYLIKYVRCHSVRNREQAIAYLDEHCHKDWRNNQKEIFNGN